MLRQKTLGQNLCAKWVGHSSWDCPVGVGSIWKASGDETQKGAVLGKHLL